MHIAKIALPIKLHTLFDYLIPEHLTERAQIGYRVSVPFGNRTLVGIIINIDKESVLSLDRLKPIQTVVDNKPLFTADLWALLLWAHRYYHYPLGEVIFHALPSLLRQGRNQDPEDEWEWQLTELGKNTDPHSLYRSKKQQALLISLQNNHVNEQYAASIYDGLKKKQLIERTQLIKETESDWIETYQPQKNPLTINPEQAQAIEKIQSQHSFSTFLLNGVTGSGKTEVYLNIIEETLQQGKQALVLVPEIGLTPQTIERFQTRFNVPVEIWHSNLTDKTRLTVWQKMKQNQSAIIIGTRSTVFCPFHELGIIIVDEEHDSSYKQQDGWRYHARDLAIMRAKQLDIPIVLGSATPSFESLHNVELGRYQQLKLTQRAGESLPPKHYILDIKGLPLKAGLSAPLIERIKHHLTNNNQVLLFLNRRGFSPVLMCHECGWIADCPRCDKPFTYHNKKQQLICHHCDSHRRIPSQCIQCGSTHLIPIGVGTEQIEQELSTLFPSTPISRIDRDSTSKRGSLDKLLENIIKGGAHILIGTQMLAKGHHFPDVTLVGVIDVDGALFSSDFRATEHFAQLYTQVSGRAGRSHKKGEVILQTHHPKHPLLLSLVEQGYQFYAEQGLKERALAYLPPFTHQIMIRAADKHNQHAFNFLNQVKEIIRSTPYSEHLWILGPVPSLYAKKAGYHYWQLLLQSSERKWLNQVIAQVINKIDALPEAKKVKWIIDVDPIEN